MHQNSSENSHEFIMNTSYFMINVHSEMSRQSSERQTEASTPFPQDAANQVNILIVVLITVNGDVDGDDDVGVGDSDQW